MVPLKKILLVDDDDKSLAEYYSLLRHDRLEFIKCNSVGQARYAIENYFFEAAIIEFKMGNIFNEQGQNLLQFLKKFSPATKSIIVSSNASNQIEQLAYKMGAELFFIKPVNLTVLRESVLNLCKLSQLQQG